MEKHPHARGEDVYHTDSGANHEETPPRTWGRPCRNDKKLLAKRNTPTHVGKTIITATKTARKRNHPHARGEDGAHYRRTHGILETPPRTWGRRPARHLVRGDDRNTPTHVGKTCAPFRRERSRQKHPHARGEDSSTVNQVFVPFETPPRTWGRQGLSVAFLYATRNTPTHVGKTGPHCRPDEAQ